MLMIVSARSRFSAYRFDGGTADCLLGFVVPRMRRGVGRFLLPRAGSSRTVRVSFARALVIAFSLLANARIIGLAWRLVRPRRRRASAVDTFRGLFFRPHHLIISCGGGGSVLIVLGCRLVLPRCSLFSSGRLSCGGRRVLSLIRSPSRSCMSWGKRRGM